MVVRVSLGHLSILEFLLWNGLFWKSFLVLGNFKKPFFMSIEQIDSRTNQKGNKKRNPKVCKIRKKK